MIMYSVLFAFIAAIISGVISREYPPDEFYYGTFPEGFKWAAATASYQIEGGWDADGKGEGIWDRFTHQDPSPIVDGSTGDVACDSYHNWKEDVQLLHKMNVTAYRFSISWPRVLPDGENVNQAGIDYYNNLIDELVKYNIQPMVTLYHWDLPQHLQEIGGWDTPDIIEYYAKYSKVCFKNFGDRVKLWITLNEPWCSTVLGHGTGDMAPGAKDPGFLVYRVAHNLIQSHAAAWHVYDQGYRKEQQGKIGVTLNCDFKYPKDPESEADKAAVERAIQFFLGWFAHPIYHADGDYPPVMREYVDRKSKEQGLDESRLPTFTDEQREWVKGTSDFFGLNHYTTQIVESVETGGDPNYFNDKDAVETQDPEWEASGSSWLKMVPWGIRGILNWIQNEYGGKHDIYVTENGWSDNDGNLDDERRAYFYTHYINNALKAIDLDGVNLKGYTAWSLMDNMEWARGYTEKFGMHAVDMEDPARKRTAKLSAATFSQIIKENGFPETSKKNLDNNNL